MVGRRVRVARRDDVVCLACRAAVCCDAFLVEPLPGFVVGCGLGLRLVVLIGVLIEGGLIVAG